MSESSGCKGLGRIFRSRVGRCYTWAKPCRQRHRDRKAVQGDRKVWVRQFVGLLGPLPRVVGRWARATENHGNALHGREHGEPAVGCRAKDSFPYSLFCYGTRSCMFNLSHRIIVKYSSEMTLNFPPMVCAKSPRSEAKCLLFQFQCHPSVAG